MPAERGDAAHGVFETLRVQDGIALAAAAHLHRLAGSLTRLYGLAAPRHLACDVERRAAALTGAHRMRVDAVPTAGAVALTLTVSPLPARPAAAVRVAIAVLPGGLGPDKLRDRAVLDTLVPRGVTPLIADADGSLLEAAWGNLWLREGGRLVTPPADGRVLPGVTRDALLAVAPALGLTAVEEPVTRARAEAAEAIVITSSVRLAVAGSLDRPPQPEPAWLDAVRHALVDHWQSGALAR